MSTIVRFRVVTCAHLVEWHWNVVYPEFVPLKIQLKKYKKCTVILMFTVFNHYR